MSRQVIYQALFQEFKTKRLRSYEYFSQEIRVSDPLRVYSSTLIFLKKNVPVILIGQISLIHAIEITAQNDCIPFTYHYDTWEIFL